MVAVRVVDHAAKKTLKYLWHLKSYDCSAFLCYPSLTLRSPPPPPNLSERSALSRSMTVEPSPLAPTLSPLSSSRRPVCYGTKKITGILNEDTTQVDSVGKMFI